MRLISELFRAGSAQKVDSGAVSGPEAAGEEEARPTLEELDLSETPLSTEACFVLASGLTQQLLVARDFEYLKYELQLPIDFPAPFSTPQLLLSKNKLRALPPLRPTPPGYEEALRQNNPLRRLRMSKTHLTDVSLAALAIVLSRLPNLQQVDLSSNFISGKSVQFLQLFDGSDHISSLNVNGNQIPHTLQIQFLQMCRHNLHVQKNAGVNQLRADIARLTEETKPLPDALERNEYLKESLAYERGLLGKVEQQAQEAILNLQQQINLSKEKIQEFGRQKETILAQTAEEKALTSVLKQKSVDNLKQL